MYCTHLGVKNQGVFQISLLSFYVLSMSHVLFALAMPSPCTNNVRSIYLSDNKKRTRHKTSALNYIGIISLFGQFRRSLILSTQESRQE